MSAQFILIPDYQVFETAFLAHSSGNAENHCLNLFRKAWVHYVDGREQIIMISQEMNTQLIEQHYKSSKDKRQALFSIVEVFSDILDCGADNAQMKLASILAIGKKEKIFYVTDNNEIPEIIKRAGNLFEVLSSEKAVKLIENMK